MVQNHQINAKDKLSVADELNNEKPSLRPKLLNDFIGQSQIKKNLTVFITAAKLRDSVLDHVLLSGPPGLGKTTLSDIIANEMAIKITSTSGPLLVKQGDLAAILTNLSENQILFIDEIHRMNRKIEEVLYSAMEDFKLDVIIGKGIGARTLKIDLPKFTLIGATTRMGMLSSPLRDRFGIPLRINFYQQKEILAIILRSAKIFNIKINIKAATEISRRSRGTPRIANRYLKRCRDFSLVAKEDMISEKLVKRALTELKVDEIGLDELDLTYLKTIAFTYDNAPVGINTLASALSEDKDTLEATCEPYLIQIGFLKKTAQGRILSDKALIYLGVTPPEEKQLNIPLVGNFKP
ncbi:MAG: Holliday junction branch migration DNA helicase RuvB [SAR324 cluster bacterium]|nr:Holliday junction branch migration DNA helicase RuvB [SAR324 cluster bacterium]